MKRKLISYATGFAAVVLMVWLFNACSDESSGNARMEVWLTDAPGDYEEVNIDIQSVQVHTNGNNPDSTAGWRSLDIMPGVYNLLTLTNGLDTLLGSVELPAGRISQIRLVLGENNSVKIDGQTYDLATPSSQQSGLKLNVQTNLEGGITYTFLLDFDAARSIVKTGTDSYSLKPVIRVLSEATSGAIRGKVAIPASMPAVFAILENDTVGSSFADSTGSFMIRGLNTGTYTVSFSPANGYTIADKTGVAVTIGQVTDVGTIVVE